MQSIKNLIPSYYNRYRHYTMIFLAFLYRDFLVYTTNSFDFLMNSIIVEPLLFIFGFGYLLPTILFHSESDQQAQALFAGNILLLMFKYTFDGAMRYAADCNEKGFITYQSILLPAPLVICEYILFQGLLTTTILLPFLPLAQLILWPQSTETNWPGIIIILFLSSLLCSAYHFCALSYISRQNASSLWARCTTPLMIFGGQWISHSIFASYSKVLGILLLFNPYIYVTEGIKKAFIGGPLFFELWYCALAIIFFIGLFTYVAILLFKRRMNHI